MGSPGSPPNTLRGREPARGAAGRYAFAAEFARGYLGTLWVARDPSDASGSAAALVRHVTPITAEATRTALLGAARAALGGPAVTLEVHEAKTGVDLVTPFQDGEVLRTLLRSAALRHAAPPGPVILALARAIASKLEELHDASPGTVPVFGGLHPDSVLVHADGQVSLLDAGVAPVAATREPWRSDPQRIGYFAPEQVEGARDPDARTDVFSLGVMVWEAFSSRRLFPGNDARSARERVLRAPIPRLDAPQRAGSPGAPEAIADLVERALSRDPAERFESLRALVSALDTLELASPEEVSGWTRGLAEQAMEKRRSTLGRVTAPPLDSGVQTLSTAPSAPDSAALGSRPWAPPSVPPSAPPSVTLPRPSARPPARASTPPPPATTPSSSEVITAPPPADVSPQLATAAAEDSAPAPPASERRPRADSAEAIEVRDEDEPGVEDGDGSDAPAPQAPSHHSVAPPPPPSLRRPLKVPPSPPLAPTAARSVAPALADRDLLGGPISVATPLGMSELGTLTAPPASRGRLWLVIGAALVLAASAGGALVVSRQKPPPQGESEERRVPPEEPRAAMAPPEVPHLEAPREERAPEPSVTTEAPREERAPEPLETTATPQEPVPTKPDIPAAPPPVAATERAELAAPSRPEPSPHSPASAPERPAAPAAPHRPPTSRSTPGATYKPGGI